MQQGHPRKKQIQRVERDRLLSILRKKRARIKMVNDAFCNLGYVLREGFKNVDKGFKKLFSDIGVRKGIGVSCNKDTQDISNTNENKSENG